MTERKTYLHIWLSKMERERPSGHPLTETEGTNSKNNMVKNKIVFVEKMLVE